MTDSKRPFYSTAFFAFLGRSGGFVIPYAVAFFFGAGAHTDAFFLSFTVMTFIVMTVTYLLESVLISWMVERKNSSEVLSKFSSGIMALSFWGALACFAVVALVLKPMLMRWSGIGEQAAVWTLKGYILMGPLLLLGCSISVANALFCAYKIFWFPAVSPLIRTALSILFLCLYHAGTGVEAAAWGLAAGEVLRWAVTFYLLCKTTPWKFRFDWKEENAAVAAFFRHGGFQILALTAFNLLPVVDQLFSSRTGPGGISLYNYAERLVAVPNQLFIVGFVTIFHTDWSEIHAQDGDRVFWEKIRRDFVRVFILTAAIGGAFFLFRDPIVRLTLFRNNVAEAQVAKVIGLFGWIVIGFAPMMLRFLCDRILYVLRKPLFCLLYSWAHLFLKIAVNGFLVPRAGLSGVGISTAVLNFFTAGVLLLYLKYLSGKQKAAAT
jgi:putative peptidoglycan lipid II flippase